MTLCKPAQQQAQLTKAFSLLILGMILATLATLNFSLAFLVGLLASPLSFVKSTKSRPLNWVLAAMLNVISPPAVMFSAASAYGIEIEDLLRQASFGWNVGGMYTPVVIWAIWWPAWTIGMVSVLGFAAE